VPDRSLSGPPVARYANHADGHQTERDLVDAGFFVTDLCDFLWFCLCVFLVGAHVVVVEWCG
jgi:hypothetical protein